MYGIKTADDAKAMLADAQHALVKAATEGTHRLADYVNEVESWSGVVSVMVEWERGLEHIAEFAGDATPDRIKIEQWKLLTRLALRGADDSWSGRGNDAKRANHDGRLKALSRIESKLSYDEEV